MRPRNDARRKGTMPGGKERCYKRNGARTKGTEMERCHEPKRGWGTERCSGTKSRPVVTKYPTHIFKVSPWFPIAMCGPIFLHVVWYSAYLLRDSIPALIEGFLDYEFMFWTVPLIIAVCLVVFRVPVRSIARDTGAVAVGFVVGDVIAFVLMLPTDTDLSSACHFSFGALFMAVCISAAAVMFSLARTFRRLKAKKETEKGALEADQHQEPNLAAC